MPEEVGTSLFPTRKIVFSVMLSVVSVSSSSKLSSSITEMSLGPALKSLIF